MIKIRIFKFRNFSIYRGATVELEILPGSVIRLIIPSTPIMLIWSRRTFKTYFFDFHITLGLTSLESQSDLEIVERNY